MDFATAYLLGSQLSGISKLVPAKKSSGADLMAIAGFGDIGTEHLYGLFIFADGVVAIEELPVGSISFV